MYIHLTKIIDHFKIGVKDFRRFTYFRADKERIMATAAAPDVPPPFYSRPDDSRILINNDDFMRVDPSPFMTAQNFQTVQSFSNQNLPGQNFAGQTYAGQTYASQSFPK